MIIINLKVYNYQDKIIIKKNTGIILTLLIIRMCKGQPNGNSVY